MRPVGWLAVLLIGFVCACDHEATVDLSTSCFDACLAASADVDVDAQLDLTVSLRDSLERSRQGLGVYVSTARALTGFVQQMIDLHPSMPDGLTYAGLGVFTAQPNPDTKVELRFYLGTDTSFGVAGDLIDFNLFYIGNYFASFGVKTTTTVGLGGISSSTVFTFDGMGPGAELLGIAPTSTSPIAVDTNAFSRQLSKVVISARVISTHEERDSSVSYSLIPEALAVGTVGSRSSVLSLEDFRAVDSSLEQSLTVADLGLSLTSDGGAYDGSLVISSMSPDFEYRARLSYELGARAAIEFSCPNAAFEGP